MNRSDHDIRLEEAAAYALGALDADRVEGFEAHLGGCDRCRQEILWLSPAIGALPEAVPPQIPPPALRERIMAEVRADAAAHAKQARREERRERAESRGGLGEWLRDLHIGGMTWKPLAGMATVVLVVAAIAGYAVGTDGGGSGAQTVKVPPGSSGIEASLVTEDGRGELHLANVRQLPDGKVLEAWVQRGEQIEPVPALFAPDQEGNASTTIENMKNVSAVLVTREPAGGTKAPTTTPIVKVPIET